MRYLTFSRQRFVPGLADLPGRARNTILVSVPSSHQKGLIATDLVVYDRSLQYSGPATPPLLVLPGLRGSDQGLARVLAPLKAKPTFSGETGFPYPLRVVNPPGMGISPASPAVTYDLETLAYLASSVASQMSSPPILVGHSFGATWAAATTHLHPELFTGLILLSPIVTAPARTPGIVTQFSTYVTGKYCQALQAGVLPRWYLDRTSRGWISNLILSNGGFKGWLRVVQGSREKQIYRSDPAAVAAAQWAATYRDVTEFVTASDWEGNIPTVVIAGSKDPLAPLDQLQTLAGQLCPTVHNQLHGSLTSSNTSFVKAFYLLGAGHLMHHENYSSVSACLRKSISALTEVSLA